MLIFSINKIQKKRYTGFCYHSEDQKEPTLDAKGIELVRRDQCGVTQKIQEKSLKIFFRSQNLNYLRQFLCDQWVKMHLGIGYKIPLQDFVFRKVFFNTISNILEKNLIKSYFLLLKLNKNQSLSSLINILLNLPFLLAQY